MEENESNRLSPLTSDDHAGKLWIVTILSLIYTLHVAVARVYIKYRMLGVDDALYGVAVVSINHSTDHLVIHRLLTKGRLYSFCIWANRWPCLWVCVMVLARRIPLQHQSNGLYHQRLASIAVLVTNHPAY